MKKMSWLFCIILLFCTACTNGGQDEASFALNQIPLDSETKSEPTWALGVETEGQLFKELNLDGVGTKDDEAYVSMFQFGDFEDKVIVLRVHLGTGETMARVFPVYGHYTFQTGTLFSKEKDAIVLEVQAPGSNYGAADIFVLDIYPKGTDPIPTIVMRLDTSAEPIKLVSGDGIPDFRGITDGAKITDVEGAPLQGLEVFSIGPKGKWRELHKILYWTGDGWSLLGK